MAAKTCKICRWYAEFEGVCCNGESVWCADCPPEPATRGCEKWEANQMALPHKSGPGYHNYFDACARCGELFTKRDLLRVKIADWSGTSRQMAFLCADCMAALADWMGADVPDLDAKPSDRLYRFASCTSCYATLRAGDRYCPKCGLKKEVCTQTYQESDIRRG